MHEVLELARAAHGHRWRLASSCAGDPVRVAQVSPLIFWRANFGPPAGTTTKRITATVHIKPLHRGQAVPPQYRDGGSWYERVIVLHTHGNEYWVLSPEFDLFPVVLPRHPAPTGLEGAPGEYWI